MGRVALDAMGGDHAPAEVVAGALEAVSRDSSLETVLVGREADIRACLPGGELPERVTLVHAADVIGMGESPVEALRRKPDSSIARTVQILAAREADAAVSAGNTGGVVAASTFLLPRLPHARRAGIAVPFPARDGTCVLMDVGANIQCKPVHLVQYALMAREYARIVVGADDPRVGVLSVGGEEGKGGPLVKKVGAALKAMPGIRFIGNVEGQDVFAGLADVVLCDGFVGNVILKAVEGLSEVFLHHLIEELRSVLGDAHAAVGEVLDHFRRRTDYSSYGGAPLMGHQGAVFICHGRSGAAAIANAILAADAYVQAGVEARIARALDVLDGNDDVAAALQEGGS